MVAAHPDDETLGAGGTIPRHVENGDEVWVCLVSDGVGARHEQQTSKEMCREGVRGARRPQVVFCGLPDQGLDAVASARSDPAYRGLYRGVPSESRLHAFHGRRQPGSPVRLPSSYGCHTPGWGFDGQEGSSASRRHRRRNGRRRSPATCSRRAYSSTCPRRSSTRSTP